MLRRLMTNAAAGTTAAIATARIHGRFRACPSAWSSERVPGPVRASVAGDEADRGGQLVAAVLAEEPVRRVHGARDRHGPGHRAGRGRGRETEREQRTAAGLAEARRVRVRLARLEAHLIEEGAGALDAAAAERAEELLAAVGRQGASDAESKGEQADVA